MIPSKLSPYKEYNTLFVAKIQRVAEVYSQISPMERKNFLMKGRKILLFGFALEFRNSREGIIF